MVAGERRADLALPGALPVAELLPELARAVGVLDGQTAYGGYSLLTSDGRTLSGDTGLTFQGVEDGGVLTISSGVDEEPPRVYDDIVEAMADAVENDMRPWEPAAGRRTALSAAALLLGLGALALALQRPDLVAGAAAGVAALVLLAAALVLARVQQEPEAALTLAWGGVVYAAVSGLTAAAAGPLLEAPAAIAGAGAVLAGLVALVGLGERRALVLPAVVTGAVVAAASGIVTVSSFSAGAVYTVALVVAVVIGSALPWVALGATSTRVDQAHSDADITAEPRPVQPEAVRRDARLGHEILLAVTTTVGLLIVLVAPLAVRLGVTGALVVVCACAVLMLRTRQYRVGSEVAAGLGGAGVAGLVALSVSVLVEQPTWHVALALLLAATGAVLLVFTLVPMTPSVRRGRLGDISRARRSRSDAASSRVRNRARGRGWIVIGLGTIRTSRDRYDPPHQLSTTSVPAITGLEKENHEIRSQTDRSWNAHRGGCCLSVSRPPPSPTSEVPTGDLGHPTGSSATASTGASPDAAPGAAGSAPCALDGTTATAWTEPLPPDTTSGRVPGTGDPEDYNGADCGTAPEVCIRERPTCGNPPEPAEDCRSEPGCDNRPESAREDYNRSDPCGTPPGILQSPRAPRVTLSGDIGHRLRPQRPDLRRRPTTATAATATAARLRPPRLRATAAATTAVRGRAPTPVAPRAATAPGPRAPSPVRTARTAPRHVRVR